MNKEQKLQSDIVIYFSQNYPNNKGQLFSVRNTTFSQRDGQTQKAMGMIAGVSDLILVWGFTTYALEVKHPEMTHKKEHVENQINWGEKLESCGWKYFVITSVNDFIDVLNMKSPYWTIHKVKNKLTNSKNTLKFCK